MERSVCQSPTKKEPIRTLGFTSRPACYYSTTCYTCVLGLGIKWFELFRVQTGFQLTEEVHHPCQGKDGFVIYQPTGNKCWKLIGFVLLLTGNITKCRSDDKR